MIEMSTVPWTTTAMPELAQKIVNHRHRPHHRQNSRSFSQIYAQSVLTGLRSMILPQPETSVQMSRTLFQRRPGTLVRLHPSRTVRAILAPRVSDHNRSSDAGLAGILSPTTNSFRCRFPPPALFWASDVGYLGMGHVRCSSVVGVPPLPSPLP